MGGPSFQEEQNPGGCSLGAVTDGGPAEAHPEGVHMGSFLSVWPL